MMRSLSLGLALAGEAERRVAARARGGVQRAVFGAVAAIMALGALIFASVGVLWMMAPAIGPGPAALVVAAGWVVLAIAAAVVALKRDPRATEPVLPPKSGDLMLGALADDLGRNSPWLALAALVIGAVTASRG